MQMLDMLMLYVLKIVSRLILFTAWANSCDTKKGDDVVQPNTPSDTCTILVNTSTKSWGLSPLGREVTEVTFQVLA